MNLQVGKLKMPEKDITLNLSKTKTKLICKTLTADSTSIYTAISNHLKHHSPFTHIFEAHKQDVS